MKDKYIPDLIMGAINSYVGSWDLVPVEYHDGSGNTPKLEQTTAIRLSVLRELLDDIFKED